MTERQTWEFVRSVQLRVSYGQAKRELESIDNKKLQDAIEAHWNGDGNTVTPQSKCWLFCWATTGINSPRTADACRAVWNQIFSRRYEWFDKNVGYDFSREPNHRYGRGPIGL